MESNISVITDKILTLYLPEYRFLKTVEADYPNFAGSFAWHEKSYTYALHNELSAANSVTLLNQIALVCITYSLINKKIYEVAGFELTESNFIEKFTDYIYLRKIENLSFRQSIISTSNLSFNLTIDKVTNRLASQNLIFFHLTFSLSNNSHMGEVVFCYHFE